MATWLVQDGDPICARKIYWIYCQCQCNFLGQELYVHVCTLQHVKLQRFGISKLCMMLVFRFNQLYAFWGGLNSCIVVMLTLSNLSFAT
jgi:hypothetical protein